MSTANHNTDVEDLADLPPPDITPPVTPAAAASAAASAAATAAASATATAAAAATAAEAKKIRDELIGTKIAKDFNGVPYLGEVTSTRRAARKGTKGEGEENDGGLDLYKIRYRDGDVEDLERQEVLDGHTKYQTLQEEMLNHMIRLVGLTATATATATDDDDGLSIEKLTSAGITDISKLELFGGDHGKGEPMAGIDLPLMKRQELYVIATFLLNDGILTSTSRLEDLARINLEKSRPVVVQSSGSKAATTTATNTTSSNGRGRGRGRPRKANAKTPTTKKKTITKSTVASRGRSEVMKGTNKRGRGRPRKDDANTPPPTTTTTQKSPVAKKARPAPRDRSQVNSTTEPTETTTTVNRGRGRPPKKIVPTRTNREVYNGPVPAEDWTRLAVDPIPGWTKVSVERPLSSQQTNDSGAGAGAGAGGSKTHVDHYWKSPGGHVLRSIVGVAKFLKALVDKNGNEDEAKNVYKSFDLKASS